MSSLLLLSFLTGSRTIQTPTRTGWLNCRSTSGCSLCCSGSCAWFMTNAMKTVLEWTRYLQRWDNRGSSGTPQVTIEIASWWVEGWNQNLYFCHDIIVILYYITCLLPYIRQDLCVVQDSVKEICSYEVHLGRDWSKQTSHPIDLLKCWTANMWGSFSKLFKDSALFPLTHNKINERCGSGTGDGFTGEINTLTQFSQCENQIKIDLLNIESYIPWIGFYILYIHFSKILVRLSQSMKDSKNTANKSWRNGNLSL